MPGWKNGRPIFPNTGVAPERMRIAAACLHPYCLPLKRPWIAASAVLRERRGMLVSLTDADGTTGWGDCAPLPSSGPTGHARVFDALAAFVRQLSGSDSDQALVRSASLQTPEVRWAVETALFDLEARRRGVPLACHFGVKKVEPLPVNAALGALDADCSARAVGVLAQGFTVAKIKVGVEAIDTELRLLHQVHEKTGGRLRLRLDANRAWNDADAWRFLTQVIGLPIDSVEEPLAQPSLEKLHALQVELPYAIAMDESLPVLGASALLEAKAARRLVIKPARIGGITTTRELITRAHSLGIEVVLTSVVDSAIGVAAAAHLAAASAPDIAHGLATLDWLAADVATAPQLSGGKLLLNNEPGLGLTPFHHLL